MRKLVHASLVVALLGLPIGLVTTGCSDDAGGNENSKVNQTKGVLPPNSPNNPEDYYNQRKGGKR
jgi:hypothetical protein